MAKENRYLLLVNGYNLDACVGAILGRRNKRLAKKHAGMSSCCILSALLPWRPLFTEHKLLYLMKISENNI